MTPLAKIVFERFEVRKTRKQKTAFIEWVKEQGTREGYTVAVEKGTFGVRNIVIGNPETANVVFTAHYDTCAVLPFPNFITPKSVLIYLLYQILVVLLLFVPAVLLARIAFWLELWFAPMVFSACCFALLFLLLFGPANRHTANDNTSGVTVVLNTMTALPQELRTQTAFILFDQEEAGLFGSSAYYAAHKKQMRNKLLVNLDCVSDGKHILVTVRRKARSFIPLLEQAFASEAPFTVEVCAKGVFYPSDQASFPCGVGVAALKQSKRLRVLYMDRIHTTRDMVYDTENIKFLTDRAVHLATLAAQM